MTKMKPQHNHIHGLITMAHIKGLYTRFPERFQGNTPDIKVGVNYHLVNLDDSGCGFAKQNTALQFINEVNEDQKVWEALYKAKFDAITESILSGKDFNRIIKEIHNDN